MFSYVSEPFLCLPWRSVCWSPLPIFLIVLLAFLECCHVCSLYILEIKPFSQVSLANTFSEMGGSLFILILFSLALQKLFPLMRSHLFILSFITLGLGDISVKTLLREMSDIFLPMFSSMTLMVSWLIFHSFIHLELIFVYGVSWCSSFIYLHVAVQLSQHHLLKRLFLLHFILLPPLSKIDRRDLGLFLGSLFCSIGLSVCFYASTRLLWLQWPCNTVWYQVLYVITPTSFFFLKIAATIWGHLWFHINFWSVYSISVK